MGSFQLKIVENSTAESEGNFGSVLNCSESIEKGELLVNSKNVGRKYKVVQTTILYKLAPALINSFI